MPGTRLTAMGANIDITPTFIDIAGLQPHPEHDGKSLMPLLLSSQLDDAPGPSAADAAVPRAILEDKQQVEAGWRTSLIIEYISVGTYYVSSSHYALSMHFPGSFCVKEARLRCLWTPATVALLRSLSFVWFTE